MYPEHGEGKRWLVYVQRILIIFVANVLCVTAINGFFVPAKLLSGGVGGLGIMVQYLTEIPSGITVFLINIPIFLIGAKKVDKDFAVYGFISMLIFSILLTVTKNISQYIPLDDIVLFAVFGGVINGAGMGLLFRNRSSQGGLDIIAAVLKRKYNLNLGSALMMLNSVIIALASILFGLDKGLYTLLSMYVAYYVLDWVQIGFSNKKSIFIISSQPEAIAQEILSHLKRGITVMDGIGAYSKQNKRILYCVITSKEVVLVKNIINKLDPQAFIIISDVVEVKGRGFKKVGI